MYKNPTNTANPALFLAAHSKPHHHHIPPAARPAGRAHPSAVRPHNWKTIAGGTLMCLVLGAVLNIIVINAVFFPDCNRITNDCFLIQHLWGGTL